MIIKVNNENKFLVNKDEMKRFLGFDSKYAVIMDRETLKFSILEDSEIDESEWSIEEVDGRQFRKVKKDIVAAIGDHILYRYKNTEDIFDILSNKFINTSAVSDVIKNALAGDQNLILFGKGGFGKSEMCSELFCRPELKDRVFIKSLSEATSEEDLFGGINIKRMSEDGVQEFIVENSFANKEIVIFEEIFDANPKVLAALKDTLTSKEVRNGNQRFPIKTKIVIGLTNKTYEEVIEDDSTEALTQRFPVSFKLQYDLSKLDIASLVRNRYKDFDDNKLAAMVESMWKMKDVTPRKVLEIAKYIKDLKIRKNKKYSEKITNNMIEPIIDFLKHKSSIDLYSTLFNEVVVVRKNVRIENQIDYDTLIDTCSNLNIIKPDKSIESITAKSLIGEIDETIKYIMDNI